MNYNIVDTKYECHVIDKLNTLNNPVTFFQDVRRFTRQITTDHYINIWQRLSEIRYNEITGKTSEED
jgi:hypothetical protein